MWIVVRDRFWCLLEQIRYDEDYYQHYRRHAQIIDNCFSGVSLFATGGGIAAWSLWSCVPWLWGIIIGIAQVAQIVRPMLPYSKRLAALKYLIPDIRKLFASIDQEWSRLQMSDDLEYKAAHDDFAARFIDLKSKYLGDDSIPIIKKIETRAWAECKHYLEINFLQGGSANASHNARSANAKLNA